jgi:hypothetical protein
MIGNFFQSLERHDVEYLLISGQATVLYGAATFSEDIDVWLNPVERNIDRLVVALRDCDARYYKLTPPITIPHLIRGHGFHFILPGSGRDQIYVDLMGKPPRVDSFAKAVETARWMETEWGEIHTIGIKPLVELKKTQRLEDYPIISRLALAWFDQPECGETEADPQIFAQRSPIDTGGRKGLIHAKARAVMEILRPLSLVGGISWVKARLVFHGITKTAPSAARKSMGGSREPLRHRRSRKILSWPKETVTIGVSGIRFLMLSRCRPI